MLDSTVVFNEIMYNPGPDQDLEWIELHSQMAVDMDLSRWRIDGIGYTFPPGAILAGGDYLVVAKSPEKLRAVTGIDGLLGPYTGQISNSGEPLRLINNSGRVMDQIDFSDLSPWPVAADGSGSTLAKINPDGASEPATNWTLSDQTGGTPGAMNFSPDSAPPRPAERSVLINEVPPAATTPYWIELHNPRSQPMDLRDFVLKRLGSGESSHRFAQQVVAGNGYLRIDLNGLGPAPAIGDRLVLYAPGEEAVVDAVDVQDRLQARSAEQDYAWRYPSRSSPGAANPFEGETDIVINEIMYHAPGVSATAGRPPTLESTTLIAIDTNSQWRYRESAVGLPTDWASEAHPANVDGWQAGPALLGFESAALAEPLRTVLRNPSIQFPHITTYYFENEFTMGGEPNDPTLELFMDFLVDDGAVFYLNGTEVHRFNIPDGAINSTTFAATAVGNATKSSNVAISKDALRSGVNRLSVEVHQADSTSNDIVFGLELRGRRQTAPMTPGTPFLESNEQWIELFNRGSTRTIDLSGWSVAGGVEFQFPAGTRLGPGEYLVIAHDVPSLRAKYPQQNHIVGSFQGRLSHRDERILLNDARGNPVDEVHYFDSGRWPEHADGGGSSLELRDAWADNAKPESWQASDETDRARWATIRYRGIVAPDGFAAGVTTRYQEFIFGLLAAGEVMIDDVSVIEDPSGAAIERIQNGSFQQDVLGGTPEHWRIAGNHHGQVTLDPDNPSNQVLHVRATGPLEDRLNHAETTFVDNARIRTGVEYEISLRARWLAGSNQLNTRLYFDRLQQTHSLDRPRHVGTPGQTNRSAETNIGPNYEKLAHNPVVPDADQPVTVTVSAADPQGVSAMRLWYSVQSGPLQNLPMTDLGGGLFTGEIPGQSAASVVQFFVEGTDEQGAWSYFPAGGPTSRALYKVQDNRARDGALHNFRIIMTPDDTALLHERTNVTSNDRLGGTVIYNERDVFYEVGVRLRGSNAGRSDLQYLGYNVQFDPMNRFRGVHDSVSIDRSGRSSLTPLTQDEILIKHIANHAGDIPSMYDDLVHVIAPDPRHSRTALLMMARYDDVFLDSQYENGSEGTVFKMDIAYVPNGTTDRNPESPKLPFPYSHPSPTRDMQDLGDDKEAYRAHLLIENNRAADDYSPIIRAAQTLSLRGGSLDEVVDQIIDVDQWARLFALQSLVGAADVYTRGELHHNINFYVRPTDNRVLAFPWDWDFAFTASSSQPLIGSSGAAGRLMSRPIVRRLVHGHMLDIINTTFHSEYLDPWIDHYGQVARQNLSPIKSYVTARRQFVLSRLPSQIVFQITTGKDEPLIVDNPIATLEGKGWIDVREIRLAGQADGLNVRWLDEETWQVQVSLAEGDQTITLEAFDHQGNRVGTDQVSVRSSVSNPVRESLRVTELNYHPADPTVTELARDATLESSDFEFIEFQNVGDRPINLLNVRLDDGVEFVFPDVVLEPNEIGVVVGNENAFRIRYGQSVRVLGEISNGRFANEGERVWLRTSDGQSLLEFPYSPQAPWPANPDGGGPTLELIDPANTPLNQYGRADRWRASAHAGGSPGSLSGAGQLHAGDLDGDGRLTDADIERVSAAIRWENWAFDLNQDHDLDQDDLNYFVESILGTSIGDANLDGVFNSSDLVLVFQRGKYEDGIAGNATWADGDWNGDGEFDTSDLVAAFQAGGFLRTATPPILMPLTRLGPLPSDNFNRTQLRR